MNDAEEQNFGGRAFEEILRIGKWIVARRKLKREDLFKTGVEPLLSELSEVYSEFLDVIQSARSMLREVSALQGTRTNDTEDRLKSALVQVVEAEALLQKGRIKRRELYEHCLARYVELNSTDPLKNFEYQSYLSSDDIELLANFYEALLSYFRNEEKEYSHDMRGLLLDLRTRLDLVVQKGFEADSVDKLQGIVSFLVKKETEFNKLWSEAVGVRYSLELKLS